MFYEYVNLLLNQRRWPRSIAIKTPLPRDHKNSLVKFRRYRVTPDERESFQPSPFSHCFSFTFIHDVYAGITYKNMWKLYIDIYSAWCVGGVWHRERIRDNELSFTRLTPSERFRTYGTWSYYNNHQRFKRAHFFDRYKIFLITIAWDSEVSLNNKIETRHYTKKRDEND